MDGEISRVKNMSSSIGGIIDSLSDRCVEILVFTDIAYGAWCKKRVKDGLEYFLKTDRKLEKKS